MADTKTERFVMRLTPEEKETLRRASELLEDADITELVRRSALLTARNIIDLHEGKINQALAMAQYTGLLYRFVSMAFLAEMVKAGKYPQGDYEVKVSLFDESGNEVHL